MKSKNNRFSVLIVDDDKDICLILKSGLSSMFSVHCEHSIAAGEDYLLHHKTSILFLDNSLPDGKGVECIEEITRLQEDIKIVMMTADASSAIKDRAIAKGACYFIAKPFKLSMIKEIVSSIFPNLSAA
jgi:DNA-binding NtrC family response regulator